MVLNRVLYVVLNLMLNSISFHFNDFLVRVSVTEYRCDTGIWCIHVKALLGVEYTE